MATVDAVPSSEKGALNESAGRGHQHGEEAIPDKQRHRVRTHLTNGDS
jgi:hypothetical protein